MKQLLAVALVLVFAVTAFAGDNPQVQAYISFDPAGDPAATSVEAVGYTTVSAYFCLTCVEGGMTTVSVMFNDVTALFPGVIATKAFVNLLPGNLAIGDAFVGGVTVASTECMVMDPVVVGQIDMFYLGGPAGVEILDHIDYPRWVVDCQDPGQVDLYCIASHGSISGGVIPDGEDCPCGSPVEDATWGGIKALYR